VDRVNLAGAYLGARRPDRAYSELQDVAVDVLSLNDVDLTINLIEMLAAALAEMGDAPRAARLLGTAETMREQADLPRPAPDATLLEHTMAKVRITVDESTWDGHVEDGRSLSAEAAIAEGLQLTD
jgi:hypothetical protein